jgi:hypothetical protein
MAAIEDAHTVVPTLAIDLQKQQPCPDPGRSFTHLTPGIILMSDNIIRYVMR